MTAHCTTHREGFLQFLVRLCASVGGLVATSALLSSLVKNLVSFLCCLSPASGGAVPGSPDTAGAGAGAGLLGADPAVPLLSRNILQPPAS